MNFTQPINITYKSEINKLGEALIKARKIISESNESMHFTAIQQLRLIHICCLTIMKNLNPSLKVDCESVKSLENICSFFEDISSGNKTWIKDYLSLDSDNFFSIDLDKAIKTIQNCYKEETFSHLLPYALEILEYSERDLENAERDRRNGIITVKKKKRGIYYTPNDIVYYMVDTCINELSKLASPYSLDKFKFIDFSCGSGVFLLQILKVLIEKHGKNDVHEYISIIESSLFGIDISPCAVDNSRFLIISYISSLDTCGKLDYDSLIAILNQNIICADATKLHNLNYEYPDFPQKFNCIIGNPPYVTATDSKKYSEGFFRSNLFIPFIHNLIDYSEECSVCALIVPLSFTYSSYVEFKKLRKRIEQDVASWKIENYDRSPDSLFGDDVRSRNCIIVRESNHGLKNICTTGLLRWTSVNRNDFLLSPKIYANISNVSIESFIPKLRSGIELEAYKTLSNQETSLLQVLKPTSPESKTKLVMNCTAYNWICAYDHIPPSVDESGNIFVSKGKKYFSTDTIDDLYFALACLNSVTSFWFWTVIGDGFHVTNRFLEYFGIGKHLFNTITFGQMVDLGKEFSEQLLLYPTQSINKGKIITNYNHMNLMKIVFEIDERIAAALNLSDDFPTLLHEWYSKIVNCGRTAKNQVTTLRGASINGKNPR